MNYFDFSQSNIDVEFPFFMQKQCASDKDIAQMIKDIFPANDGKKNNQSFYRPIDNYKGLFKDNTSDKGLTQMEIDMKISIYCIGRDDHVTENLVTMLARQDDKHNTKVPPVIIPSQAQSKDSPIDIMSHRISERLSGLGKSVGRAAIREVLPLFPSGSDSKEPHVSRRIRTSVDNTIFIYPTQYLGFAHRNLCVKVELVEIHNETLSYNSASGNSQRNRASSMSNSSLMSTPMVALPNIYNNTTLKGVDFVSEAYSRVSYHSKNPSMNDEFKIRLPDLLTWRHQLKFTVMHIHVKPKEVGRSSILPSLSFGVKRDTQP